MGKPNPKATSGKSVLYSSDQTLDMLNLAAWTAELCNPKLYPEGLTLPVFLVLLLYIADPNS